jgi:hypothetical protein
VVIGESVRRFVEGYFQLKALGASRIKGVSEPVNVYEVTGLGPLRTRLQRSVGRGLTKFVGREREMEALKHAAEQAKSGHGQIVAAMAEPGSPPSLIKLMMKEMGELTGKGDRTRKLEGTFGSARRPPFLVVVLTRNSALVSTRALRTKAIPRLRDRRSAARYSAST